MAPTHLTLEGLTDLAIDPFERDVFLMEDGDPTARFTLRGGQPEDAAWDACVTCSDPGGDPPPFVHR